MGVWFGFVDCTARQDAVDLQPVQHATRPGGRQWSLVPRRLSSAGHQQRHLPTEVDRRQWRHAADETQLRLRRRKQRRLSRHR